MEKYGTPPPSLDPNNNNINSKSIPGRPPISNLHCFHTSHRDTSSILRLEKIVLDHKPPSTSGQQAQPAVQLIPFSPPIVPPHKFTGSHSHSHSPQVTVDPEPRETPKPKPNRTASQRRTAFPQHAHAPASGSSSANGTTKTRTETRTVFPLRPKEHEAPPRDILSAQHPPP